MSSNNSFSEFQDLLGYTFKNKNLLAQAFTTPQLGNELKVAHYDILETLGDAVIKTILVSKKIKEGAKDITKLKQGLENNITLSNIASKYFGLENYIRKASNQELAGTKILADVLEALCGAIYLDSNHDILLVEKIIVDKFYDDWDKLMDPTVLSKNDLLEHLQKIFKITPIIKSEYEGTGLDNKKAWIAKNPKIVNDLNQILLELPSNLKSKPSKTKKEADKDLYSKILQYLRNKER